MQSNFPDFFFYNKNIDKFKNLKLTEQEQELLGLEKLYEVYSYELNDKIPHLHTSEWYESVIKEKTSLLLKNLPYEYIKSVGSINLYHLHDTLISKIGQHGDVIFDYLRHHPNVLFDINQLSEKDIFYMFCEFPMENIQLLLKLFSNHTRIIFQSYTYDRTGRSIKRYIQDEQSLQSLFQKNKTSIYNSNYCINDKFSELVQIERQHSNDTVYLAKLQQGTPVNFEGDEYLILTDKGQKLLAWCLKYLACGF
jgi:hypothetical protein